MVLIILSIILRISKCEEMLGRSALPKGIELNEIEIDWRLNVLDQEDPALIKILHDYYLSLPTDLVRNITPVKLTPRNIYGQFFQGKVVDQYYSSSKYGGFFIEAGAFDGETVSNTLFLEVERNWTGILVEANPDNFKHLQSRNRNVSSIETCLSRKIQAEVVDFDAARIFGGIIVDGRPKPGENIPIKNRNRIQEIVNKTRRTIKMQCFPLATIVYALGNPKIDYLSLDIEGAELEILKTIPFDKLNIQLISVEIIRKKLNDNVSGNQADHFDDIVTFLEQNGYKLLRSMPHTLERLSFEVFF